MSQYTEVCKCRFIIVSTQNTELIFVLLFSIIIIINLLLPTPVFTSFSITIHSHPELSRIWLPVYPVIVYFLE